MGAATTNAEHARLEALHRYAVLDTPPEPAFDEVVRRAVAETGYRTALLTLMAADRCWFKASAGLKPVDAGLCELPRHMTFCTHFFQSSGVFVVPDARTDVRFAGLPFISREDGYRSYAGVQLITPDGHSIGTLCVLDDRPREPTDAHRASLHRLAGEAMVLLEARRSPPAPSAAPDRRIRALIVDDEPYLRLIAGEMLKHLGYAVVEAADGAEALDLFRRDPSGVQLVLTDLNMPGMHGMALVQELRREPRPPAIVVMSGRLDARTREELGIIGVTAMLSKPFTLDALHEALVTAVAR